MNQFVNKVIEGDCMDILEKFEPGSIDFIVCDLPYGNTHNGWDKEIDLPDLWKHYKRIIKPNGVIALTGSGLFTGKLILSNPNWFRYKIVWIKSKATNFLNAKKQPLRRHEDICIFYRKSPFYNPQMGQGEPYDKGVRKCQQTGCYGEQKPAMIKNTNGQRYPTDVVFYEAETPDFIYYKTAEAEGACFHPTQKPIELGKYLIRTYTRPGDIILDNACGCGSFLVAAALEGRRFIGIEKNRATFKFKTIPIDFVEVSKNRIRTAIKTHNLVVKNSKK